MPRFTICVPGQSNPITDMIATDPGSVLGLLYRVGCQEADIRQDGSYLFSARLDPYDVWSIFDRRKRDESVWLLPAARVAILKSLGENEATDNDQLVQSWPYSPQPN